MRKNILLIILTLCFLAPVGVNADSIPPYAEAYTEDEVIQVGTTITYNLSGVASEDETGNDSDINGKIIYNSNELELITFEFEEGYCYYDECGEPSDEDLVTTATIKIIANEPGSFEYEIISTAQYGKPVEVNLTFIVKSVPSDSEMKIKFIPDDVSVLEYSDYETDGYIEKEVMTSCKDGYCPEDDYIEDDNDDEYVDDNYEEPVDDNTEDDFEDSKEDDNIEEDFEDSKEDDNHGEESKESTNVEEKEKKKDNTIIYVCVTIVLCAIIAAIVILVVKSKKKYNNIDVTTVENVNSNNVDNTTLETTIEQDQTQNNDELNK